MSKIQETPQLVLKVSYKSNFIQLTESLKGFIKISKCLKKNERLSDEQQEFLEGYGSSFGASSKNTFEGEMNEYWVRINLKKKTLKVWL